MDEIQKVLVKAGRKDLAQKYYEKTAAMQKIPGSYVSIISKTDARPTDKTILEIVIPIPGQNSIVANIYLEDNKGFDPEDVQLLKQTFKA